LEQCDGQTKLKSLFESWKEKGIIKKNYNPEKFIPDEISESDAAVLQECAGSALEKYSQVSGNGKEE
jgi:hypothetical protein